MAGSLLLLFAGLFVFVIADVLPLEMERHGEFQGNRISSPDDYSIEFTMMDQEDGTVFWLEKGEVLEVSYQIEKGKMDLVIGMEKEKPIFRGNSISEGEFAVTADQTGKYVISINARRAAGFLEVKKK